MAVGNGCGTGGYGNNVLTASLQLPRDRTGPTGCRRRLYGSGGENGAQPQSHCAVDSGTVANSPAAVAAAAVVSLHGSQPAAAAAVTITRCIPR